MLWATPESFNELTPRQRALVDSHLPRLANLLTSKCVQLRWTVSVLGFDDAYQIGAIGFMRASKDFDPKRYPDFLTWARVWAKKYLWDAATRVIHDRRRVVSVDPQTFSPRYLGQYDYVPAAMSREPDPASAAGAALILALIHPEDRWYLEKRLAGYSPLEIDCLRAIRPKRGAVTAFAAFRRMRQRLAGSLADA
jgi:hypothetical protein